MGQDPFVRCQWLEYYLKACAVGADAKLAGFASLCLERGIESKVRAMDGRL
jgi:hypothetical protein